MKWQNVNYQRKLSNNLEGAVNDCIAAKRAGLRLDMCYWHLPSIYGDPCSVCMAGARMDQTLKADRDKELHPDMFDSTTEKRLNAIDFMREGDFLEAYWTVYGKFPSEDIKEKLIAIGKLVLDRYVKRNDDRAPWATISSSCS